MLKIVRLEEKVSPGNKLVVCTAGSLRIKGTNVRFKQNEPVEVTKKQFEYLMQLNAQVGRVLVKEYTPPKKAISSSAAKRETAREIFAVLPSSKSEVENDNELDSMLIEEEPDSIAERQVGKKMRIVVPPSKSAQDEEEEEEADNNPAPRLRLRPSKQSVEDPYAWYDTSKGT